MDCYKQETMIFSVFISVLVVILSYRKKKKCELCISTYMLVYGCSSWTHLIL